MTSLLRPNVKYQLADVTEYLKKHQVNRELIKYFDENLQIVFDRIDSRGFAFYQNNIIASAPESALFVEVDVPVSPKTPVTINTCYGELAKAYYVLGSVNGCTDFGSLWRIAGNLLKDASNEVYYANRPKIPVINYNRVQQDWEDLFFTTPAKRQRMQAIAEKRQQIQQLEAEIAALGVE